MSAHPETPSPNVRYRGGPPESPNHSVPVENNNNNASQHNDYQVPMICTFLSFIFPPTGWIGFIVARHSPKESPRGVWAFRAVAVGSLLSFLYSFIAAALVGYYKPLSDSNAIAAGCGRSGKLITGLFILSLVCLTLLLTTTIKPNSLLKLEPIERDLFLLNNSPLYGQGSEGSDGVDAPSPTPDSSALIKLHLLFLNTPSESVAVPSLWYDWLRKGTEFLKEALEPVDAKTVENLLSFSHLYDPNQVPALCSNLSLSCVSSRLGSLARSYDVVWPVAPDAVPAGSASRMWQFLAEDGRSLISAASPVTQHAEIIKPVEGQQPTTLKFGTGLILRRPEIRLLSHISESKIFATAPQLLQSLSAAVWGLVEAADRMNVGFTRLPSVSRTWMTTLTWVMECRDAKDVACPLPGSEFAAEIERETLDHILRSPFYFALRPLNDTTQVVGCPQNLPDGSRRYIQQDWPNPTRDPKRKPGNFPPEPVRWANLDKEDQKNWSPFRQYQLDALDPKPSKNKCDLKDYLVWRLGYS